MENNIDEDIKILKEKLKILNDTKLKKTDKLERDLQAIENILSELETYKKIAEKLAEEISYTDNHICKYFDAIDKCKYEARKDNTNICKQCIIDWARKEVENEKNNSNT